MPNCIKPPKIWLDYTRQTVKGRCSIFSYIQLWAPSNEILAECIVIHFRAPISQPTKTNRRDIMLRLRQPKKGVASKEAIHKNTSDHSTELAVKTKRLEFI